MPLNKLPCIHSSISAVFVATNLQQPTWWQTMNEKFIFLKILMQWINLAVINVEANKWPERHTENIWCWSMGNFWKRRLHATNVENILQIFNAFKTMWNSLIQQQMNLLKFNAIVKNVPKFLLMLKASMLIWKHVLKTLQIWPVPYVQLKTGKFQ